MRVLFDEVRYAVRRLMRRPGFALLAILTLGLGIGANSTVFSVVHTVLLRPLPFPEPESLVRVWEVRPGMQGSRRTPGFSLQSLRIWREESRSFEHLAAYQEQTFTLGGLDEPRRVPVLQVSSSIFPMLRTSARVGRTFDESSEAPGSEPVVLLSERAHRRYFGGRDSIVGETLLFDGDAYTVLGVLPASFRFPDPETEFWVPLPASEPTYANTNHARIELVPVIGRLREGVTVEEARAEGRTILANLSEENLLHSGFVASDFELQTLQDEIAEPVRSALLLLTVGVGLVLLIACANVANIFLVRAVGRRQELAVRRALGAGLLRLVGQLLTESLLIALLGGILGLTLAALGVRLLQVLGPETVPRLDELSIAPAVIGFNFSVALATGLLSGLAPVLQLASRRRSLVLHGSRMPAFGEGSGRGLLRSSITVSEVAISMVLLICAGLLIRSFATLVAVDPGYRPQNVLAAELSLPENGYPDLQSRQAFIDDFVERLRRLPGVKRVGWANALPLDSRRAMMALNIPGYTPPAGEGLPRADLRLTGNGYFEAMGIELLEGRTFDEADRGGSRASVVVNRTLVDRYFPEGDHLGKSLAFGEVVGVVESVRHQGLDSEAPPTLYVSYRQAPPMLAPFVADSRFVLFGEGDPEDLVSAVRLQLRQADPDLAFDRLVTLEETLSRSVALPRFYAVVLSLFALTAVVMAAVGLYGVLSFVVTQRTRENGIRLALGARAPQLLGSVLREGLALTLVGAVLGLAAALAVTRVFESLLFGVGTLDPPTLVIVPLILLAVSFLACLVPGLRAVRVDPCQALRWD